ncbi:MAG: isopentenyl-diphosphate Delta-isomerase [Micromonosporaceae bacterium]
MTREAHLVELVDPSGTPLGAATVAEAHTAPGVLHRAFSVMVTDGAGRVLLQRRATTKTRFARRWSNTCCGHPAPGEPLTEAAAARLADEMGLYGVTLTEVGHFVYQASDPATGRVEHEYDHVLVGRVDPDVEPQPDPAEADDWRWMPLPALRADTRDDSDAYTPWLRGVVRLLPE